MTAKEIKDRAVEIGKQIWDKTRDITVKVVEKGKDGVKWVMENPQKAAGAAAAGAAVLKGANKLMNSVNRNVTARRELHDKKYRVYDHSMNVYRYKKRPIDSKTAKRISEERKKTGKTTCEIMDELGLLK